jgi:hypothetical protein
MHGAGYGKSDCCENPDMNYLMVQTIAVRIGAVALLVMGYHWYGWPGVAGAVGALVMWMLLHFTRMLQVLRRASHRPKGHVESSVMLNARLHPGVSLMQVVALSRSLGELRSPAGEQPEVFRWTDTGQSFVECEFQGGKLATWRLDRPPQALTDAAP